MRILRARNTHNSARDVEGDDYSITNAQLFNARTNLEDATHELRHVAPQCVHVVRRTANRNGVTRGLAARNVSVMIFACDQALNGEECDQRTRKRVSNALLDI